MTLYAVMVCSRCELEEPQHLHVTVLVVCIGHLLLAAEVLDASGHPNFSKSTIVVHECSYSL